MGVYLTSLCMQGDVESLKAQLNEETVNECLQKKFRVTALHMAVEKNQVQIPHRLTRTSSPLV